MVCSNKAVRLPKLEIGLILLQVRVSLGKYTLSPTTFDMTTFLYHFTLYNQSLLSKEAHTCSSSLLFYSDHSVYLSTNNNFYFLCFKTPMGRPHHSRPRIKNFEQFEKLERKGTTNQLHLINQESKSKPRILSKPSTILSTNCTQILL